MPMRLQPLMLEVDQERRSDGVIWKLVASFEDETVVTLRSDDAEQGDYSDESPAAILLHRLAAWLEREYVVIPVGVYELPRAGGKA